MCALAPSQTHKTLQINALHTRTMREVAAMRHCTAKRVLYNPQNRHTAQHLIVPSAVCRRGGDGSGRARICPLFMRTCCSVQSAAARWPINNCRNRGFACDAMANGQSRENVNSRYTTHKRTRKKTPKLVLIVISIGRISISGISMRTYTYAW